MTDKTPTKKSLGQHWLNDKPSLEAICEAADVQAGDHVLEIGPGTGELTKELSDKGADVLALEFDQDLIPKLGKTFANKKVKVEQGDIRSFDLSSLPLPYKIVANIPYYLTANLLRKLVDDSHKPAVAALLVQKEVAERVAANPGKLSFVGVAVQLFYEVSLGMMVPAHLFTPPPKVDSQILILKLRAQPLFDSSYEVELLRVTKAGFDQPRKKLKTSLSGGLGLPKDQVETLLKKASVNGDSRAQELTLDDWLRLAKASTPLL